MLTTRMGTASSKVLARSFAPLNLASNVIQFIAIGLVMVSGGTVLGVKYGSWQGALAAVCFIAVLLFVGALRTQLEIDELRATPRPNLLFGETHIHHSPMQQRFHDGTARVVSARFPVITLANVPPNGSMDTPEAKDVVVHLDLRGMDGTHLAAYIARCADDDEAHDVPSKKEHTERDLAANARYWSYNTVVLIDGEDHCRPWNNESMTGMRDQLPADLFLVFATARGSNTKSHSATFKVTTSPLSIKRADHQ
jgi:hypothetical protein